MLSINNNHQIKKEKPIMKRQILLSAAILFVSFVSFGQVRYQSNAAPVVLSNVNVRMENNIPFQMSMDGINYLTNLSVHQLKQVNPGNHSIQIFRTYFNGYRYVRQLILSTTIVVPYATEQSLVLDRYNRLNLEHQIALIEPQPDHQNTAYYDPYEPYQQYNTPAPRPMPDHNCWIRQMNDAAFTQLLGVIDRASFESSKIEIAKQALRSNYLTSRQVATLMQAFSFESSKLEIAKCSFNKTVDKNNYYVVNDAFYFSSSISALQEYISTLS